MVWINIITLIMSLFLFGCSSSDMPTQRYSVTYNANSATGGTAPESQLKAESIDLTLASNSGNLVRTGYTFTGWDTSAVGNGTSYAAGAIYAVNAPLTLYAKWAINEWKLLTTEASFTPRDAAGEIVFNGKMWLLGGYTPIQTNDIWSSSDGIHWTLEKDHAEWPERNCFGLASYKNRIYIVGGASAGGGNFNDVWSSSNGIDWLNEPTPGFSPRYAPSLLTYNDKLYLIGGGVSEDGTHGSNDVWVYDGVAWEKQTDAPWTPRERHATVVFDNKIWLLGGFSSEGSVLNDVWSYDGTTWKEELANAPWIPRMWFSANVYNSKMWIFGGSTISSPGTVWHPLNDVWYSNDGLDWHELPSPGWEARHEYSNFIFNDSIYLSSGITNERVLKNDVWYYHEN